MDWLKLLDLFLTSEERNDSVFPGSNTSNLNWKKKYKDISLSNTVLLIESCSWLYSKSDSHTFLKNFKTPEIKNFSPSLENLNS